MVLIRSRSGVSGEVDHCVHAAPLPIGAELAAVGMVGTLCGALAPLDQVEPMAPGVGMPCARCVLYRDGALPPATPTSYHEWGWPVAVCADRVLLILGDSAATLALPIWLTDAVTQILTARHRPAPVLAHPGAPEHLLVLVGEPFGAALPWPDGVHTISGAVPLPPTVTAFGSVRWLQPPHDPDLATCREIDVFAAVRTALRDVAQVEGGCS